MNRAHMAYDHDGVKALKPRSNGGRKHENMTVAEEKALLARFAEAALRRICGPSSGLRSISIRHSLAIYSASRKAIRRSFGRNRVGFPRSYGLSFAKAASFRAKCACR